MLRSVLILSLFIGAPMARANPYLYHAENINSCEITGGKKDFGYHVQGAYSKHFSRDIYWKLALGFSWNPEVDCPYKSIQFEPDIAFTCFDYNATIYLNLLLSLGVKYEQHETRGNEHYGFNMLCKGGVEGEFFVLPRVAIVAAVTPYCSFFSSPYGHLGYESRVGLKISF